MPDPFMPAERRFPRDRWPMPQSDEQPSMVRPFILRGAGVGSVVPVSRHRTPASQKEVTPVPTTTSDTNEPTSKPDPTYVPDD